MLASVFMIGARHEQAPAEIPVQCDDSDSTTDDGNDIDSHEAIEGEDLAGANPSTNDASENTVALAQQSNNTQEVSYSNCVEALVRYGSFGVSPLGDNPNEQGEQESNESPHLSLSTFQSNQPNQKSQESRVGDDQVDNATHDGDAQVNNASHDGDREQSTESSEQSKECIDEYLRIIKAEHYNNERSPKRFFTRRLEEKLLNKFGKKIEIGLLNKRKIVKPANAVVINPKDMDDFYKRNSRHAVALALRRDILNIQKNPLPTDLKVADLIRDPEESPRRAIASESMAYDAIHNVTRGKLKTPEHITLGMTIKSLTNSKKVVTILN
ncbi:hypothetical protein QAD02_008010 [Eretmocerus hayati]|uniref:Uncharacterized protein n=1 Tax=Eretmocerus hayati TaxID=131215 RepID=A0ACC2N6K6_9HYME|nr:hypothetical protein QAD02_008010 [Eretmocerus hayati]